MDGILCLDKPQEMTSFACCAMIRRLTGEKKVGHAGTLDPMATGVLPIMLGKATRAIPFLPTHDKQYVAQIQFGKTSDTLDIWGAVTDTGKPYPSRAAIEQALPSFRGEIRQVPPMMSALKKDGVRLYELARQGVEIEREARDVTVYRLEIQEYDVQRGALRVICDCSAGTYIRSLCDDLGRMLGCGAVMSGLRRTAAAGYGIEACLTQAQCQNGEWAAHLLPIDTVFSVYPAVTVTTAQAKRFCNGGELAAERVRDVPAQATLLRVYDPENMFLGLGLLQGESIKIARIFS